ncbi:MAG: TetR/AcrR family transcriptional regulator [Bacteroidales bacterium]|nr:TetR/AcrR family transcriptional regulator [Bacteroidales bacterium]
MSTKINKRNLILQTALKLFCSEGFQATSTARISREAEVATGTLFTYFESKDALINTLYLESKEMMANDVMACLPSENEIPKLRLKAIWIAMIQFCISHPDVFRFMMIFKNSPFIHRVTMEEAHGKWEDIYALIQQLIEQKSIGNLSPEILTRMLTAQLNAVAEYLIYYPESSEEMKCIASDSFEIAWKAFFE